MIGQDLGEVMAVLVTGPSCAGKSSFIRSEEAFAFGLDRRSVAYGGQIPKKGFATDALIHYNLLRPIVVFGKTYGADTQRTIANEPVFRSILNADCVQECIVLVAPIAELLERIETRGKVDLRYNAKKWTEILRWVDLTQLYENLFAALESRNISTRVLFSSAYSPQMFLKSDRKFLGANLDGQFVQSQPTS
jgi:hypothetical protein